MQHEQIRKTIIWKIEGFYINSVINKEKNNIKKNKFVVFKNIDISSNTVVEKGEKKIINNNIKFIVFKYKEIKKDKVLKNKKLVHDNKAYSCSSLSFNNKLKTIKHNKSFRSSSYRGVSKNGNKWQVLLMHNRKGYYFGNYKREIIAAKIYDLFAIKLHGKKAVTNFYYNKELIEIIKEIEYDINKKIKNQKC